MMKKLLTTLSFVVVFTLGLQAQYYFNAINPAGQNPGGLNNDPEQPFGAAGVTVADGYTSIIANGTTALTWSPVQTIPFSFSFNGSPVSSFKVSNTGVLTFTTSATTVPPTANTTLPSTSIPDNSVMVWGIQQGAGGSTNDGVTIKTHGTAPNRQLWVNFHSYGAPTATGTQWTYWGIVLEESTNKLYVVDQRTFNTPLTLTIGVQVNSTTAVTVGTGMNAAPNTPSFVTNGGNASSPADNVYYEFIQGTRPTDDATVIDLVAPTPTCALGTAETVTVRIANSGTASISNIPVSYSVNGGAVTTETITQTILAGDSINYSFTGTANVAAAGNYNFEIYTALTTDGNNLNDTLRTVFVNPLQSITYVENFDALASQTTGALANGWVATTTGTHAWLSNSGGTASPNTGPANDNTTGSGVYMYTEASAPAAAGEVATLTSPCIDVSTGLTNLNLEYFYHAYGASITNLFVEIDTNGVWTRVDTVAGQQQTANNSPWQASNTDLSSFLSSSVNSIRIRFVNTRGTNFTADVAIDDVRIFEALPNDVELSALSLNEVESTASPIVIGGTILNRGSQVLTSVEVNWTADGGTTINRDTLNGLNLAPGANTSFAHAVNWNPAAGSSYTVEVELENPNGVVDGDPSNDSLSQDVFAILGNTVQKKAVFEQFTTAGCQFCPDGAWVAQEMESNYTNVYTTSVHSCFGQDQMTNTEALQLCATLGFNSAPTGMVDRTLFDGETDVAFGRGNGFPNWQTSTWATRALANSQAGSAVDLLVTGSYNSSNRGLSVSVDASLVDYVLPGSLTVGLMIIEDSVTGSGPGWDQSNAYNGAAGHPFAGLGNPIRNYVHKRVMRDILPGTWGAGNVIPTNYALNTAYSRNFTSTLPTSWDANQVYVIAFVAYFGGSNLGNYQILNAERVKMNNLVTGIEDIKKDEASLKVFPNPTANLTNLSFNLSESKQVSIEVFDITGKRLIQEEMGQMVQGNQFIELDVANLPEGFYFLNLRLNDEVITKKISIVR